MFNWFKNKVELKNNNSIMSSFFNRKGLKLGSEIIVPENFECLIFHNSRHFNTLSSGKYKLDTKDFSPLIEKQKKSKKKLKYVKCVYHFVNISPQKIDIKYKKQKYTVEFFISNSLSFANLMLLYTYKVDNDYTFNNLHDIFGEVLSHLNSEYKKVNSDMLKEYGITIKSFLPSNQKVSILNTSIMNPKPTEEMKIDKYKEIEETKLEQSQKITNENDKQNNLNQPTHNPAYSQYTCSKCGNMSKFNTTYCLKCGYKLE